MNKIVNELMAIPALRDEAQRLLDVLNDREKELRDKLAGKTPKEKNTVSASNRERTRISPKESFESFARSFGGETFEISDVASSLDTSTGNASQKVRRWIDLGFIVKVERGVYKIK
tara:strand:- start:1744 stop:2091 length:348 start_codon:yes stop_codon:yes gene_type:complete